MLDSQQAAYDRFKQSSHQREERDHSQKRARLSKDTSLPKLNSIHQGRVVKIMEFGAFIQMVDVIQQGLVHKAQLSSHRVEEVADVVQVDDPVWVKVVSVDEDDSGKIKIGLSMKYVNQGNGEDMDSANVSYGREQENRKRGQIASTFNRAPIELTDAVMMNVVCRKCGGKGHLPTECFNAPGENYELIPEEDEIDYDLSAKSSHHKKDKKHKKHKKRKRESSRSASPEVRQVSSMADALSVMRQKARKDDKKSHHHRHRERRRS
ncbi:unnamed protein product [Umbelopsis sp. WA50703]